MDSDIEYHKSDTCKYTANILRNKNSKDELTTMTFNIHSVKNFFIIEHILSGLNCILHLVNMFD